MRVRLKTLAFSLLAGTSLMLSSCAEHFSIFGYTTAPVYDETIRTVYVPIPQNVTYRRGLEFDLQRALVREIESKTIYKVSSDRERADTELLVRIVGRNKTGVNFNQLNEVRDAETIVNAEVVWKDLRAGHLGECLSKPPADPLATPGVPADPLAPLPPPPPVLVTAPGSFIPELGGSLTSAEWQMINRLAVQVVSMMEKPW